VIGAAFRCSYVARTRVPRCTRSLLLGRWRTWSWWTPRGLCRRVVVLMEEMVLSSLVVLRRMIGALYLVAPEEFIP
jgi:hypothetical protein